MSTSDVATVADTLPDYAPVPAAALGAALNEQGYHVGRVERNLYWVTDGVYQAAFLTTRDGVVLLDAPPTIGHNLQRAIDEIAAADGVSNRVTHIIYSHHHADAPDMTFIHLPEHDTLMMVDIVNAGWLPVCVSNLTQDIQGYLEAPAHVPTYPWKHLVSGHLGRLGTCEDVILHQQYMSDIVENVTTALATTDPTPYFVDYGANAWAGVKGYIDAAVVNNAMKPVIDKYTGVLAAADVFTASTTFWVIESVRLDKGVGSQVHR